QEAIIWGGYWPSRNYASVTGANYQLIQARFDPQSNTWSPLASEGAPIIPVFDPLSRAVVWDGKEMLVFGSVQVGTGSDSTVTYTYRGARFGPPGGGN
ncbi:MAG TPA: hypothetical protein VKX96_10910, partial [Chloroflexota bacterium]|nr:hypothetical protein [Chloroflexota bacterium]